MFKKEYTNELVEVIETVYGEGFLSQGGNSFAAEMLVGIDVDNKAMLDIGCGLGAPAIELAKQYSTLSIVGVDVDSDLIARAEQAAQKANVAAKTRWLTTAPEAPLPFLDHTFDIIFGKESWLHIADKLAFFKECYRVLKPGGALVSLDWMHSSAQYSEQMNQFVKTDGLTFYLTTLPEYLSLLEQAGFAIQSVADKSHDNLHYSQQDVNFLLGTVKHKMIERVGKEAYQAYLESWQLQVEIFKSGEMQTFLIKGLKPLR